MSDEESLDVGPSPLRWAVDPEAVPTDLRDVPRLLGEPDDPDEPVWDLYSICVHLLMACMTEPGDPADEEDPADDVGAAET